ncbi:ABC transporter ATP-binding protein [Streptomyces sp. NBC_00448]|uniref:ABC transporter ATP-binding protein n=1 Tax=Streptomyces sp. NBC_00448 TaxID=2903652 RepID=UPI002E1BEB17
MIEATHLTKRYGATVAVDDLSFRVRPGRVTGFLGPNGAGKSTTLRMILGLTAPSGGTVTVDGVPFADRPRGLRHVGALLDAQDVHGGRSAAAHLSALARGNHIPRGRVADVLEEVGLGKAAGRRIGGFSLGMKQRLGIAAALLGEPRVLLFDEPLNGLDLEGVLWVRGLFRRLAAEGRTVLVSSHMMSEIEHTAEQVLVIGRGRLIADEHLAALSGAAHGAAVVSVRTADVAALTALLAEEGATVRQASESEEAVEVSGLPARRIGELAGHHGLTLYELATRSSSLESAFLRLTADSVEYPAGPPAGTEAGHRTGETR